MAGATPARRPDGWAGPGVNPVAKSIARAFGPDPIPCYGLERRSVGPGVAPGFGDFGARFMSGEAVPAEAQPPRQTLTLLTAAGCLLAAYICWGAPGLWGTPLAAFAPKFDPATGWLPALHLGASAAVITGGVWLTGQLRRLPTAGVAPLILFAFFQFALMACALANLALATAGLRAGGDGAWAALFILPGFAAIRLHSEMYMAVLRLTSWVRSVSVSDRGPLAGGALIALTVASNLAPLAIGFQSISTHAGAVLSALFRGAVIDPTWYWSALWAQAATISPQEGWLAAGATLAAAILGAAWALSRAGHLRRSTIADRMAASLSPAQLRFTEDALPAAIDAVQARASSGRYVAWSLFWMLAVTPAFLLAAYAAATWFGVLQEQHALSWTANAASDLTPFASGKTGWANYAIPIALVLFVLTMSGPMANLFLRGARYDRFAFGQPMAELLRARLVAATAAGTYGPNQPFDAEDFADKATRRRYWVRVPLVLAALGAAAVSGFWDVARGVAFTGDGLIVQEHYFAPPRIVRYHEIQAIALDCRIDPFRARPVYELTLPDGRIVDMIGSAPLTERLDQYIAVDRRLQFSGVGYAYPPGDLEPCLTAIQKQHNSVIAAGTARLLHVLD